MAKLFDDAIEVAVEPKNAADFHLESDDADLSQASKVSEQPQLGKAAVGNQRILVGMLPFSVSGCSPKSGVVQTGSCNGQGIVMPASRKVASTGMDALQVGDEGQCVGVGMSRSSPPVPIPVMCKVCIGQSLQDEPEHANDDQGQESKEVVKLNRFPIQLKFVDGTPVAGATWKAVGSEGTEKTGNLSRWGETTVEMKDETCSISFPEFDHSVDAHPFTQTHTVEVKFNAFIHKDVTKLTESGSKCPVTGVPCWSYEPYIGQLEFLGVKAQTIFKGDCRDFGENGTSRISQSLSFPASSIGNFTARNVQTTSEVGQSHQRQRIVLETPGGQFQSVWSTNQKKASAKDISVELEPNVIRLRGEATYPFAPGPPINYNVEITFTPINKFRCRLSIKGTHDAFPFYELIIMSRVVWKFASPDPGPDISNLTTSKPFSAEVELDFSGEVLKVITP